MADHYYTISAEARDGAVSKYGFQYEAIACYVISPEIANRPDILDKFATAGQQPNWRDSSQTPIPLHRLYLHDHFYTTWKPAADEAVARNGYTYEGVDCYVFNKSISYDTKSISNIENLLGLPALSIVPLHRLYHYGNNDHLYNVSDDEWKEAVSKYGYTYELIEGYVIRPELANHPNLHNLMADFLVRPWYRLYLRGGYHL